MTESMTGMESVRDLLDGNSGGYVAPQNRATRPNFDPTPAGAPPATIEVNIPPALIAAWWEIGQTIGRGIQQMAGTLGRSGRGSG